MTDKTGCNFQPATRGPDTGFIDGTWLETIDRHGAVYGLHVEAAAITHVVKGKAVFK